ncbi:UDP-N-acetylglucosamine 2-epimerase [bacterium]|nr:UDP-N-acetylglucosamine 2-epimerase [bacterium]
MKMRVAFIPIRSGSKSVPHKNIKLLNGIPLFHHVAGQALKSDSIDEVWVSTDSEYYASLVPEGVKVHMRSDASASDTSPTSEVLKEFIEFRPEASTIVILQATSPLTTSTDICNAVSKSLEGKGVVSVTKTHVFLYENNKPLYSDRKRRQDSETFKEDGSIYIVHAFDFRETSNIPTLPCITIQLPHEVCDIDNEDDFRRAESLMCVDKPATFDIGGTYIRLQSKLGQQKWHTCDHCHSKNSLRDFVLHVVSTLSERRVNICTGGQIVEESGHYIVAEATDVIPNWKGTVIPKHIHGKVINVQNDGDCAVSGLVETFKLHKRNVALFVFGTGIATGLYMNGHIVKNAELAQHLETVYCSQNREFDNVLLTDKLCKIRKMLCLDDIYVSGFITKYEDVVEHLESAGVHVVDGYYNHVGAQLVKEQRKHIAKYTTFIAEVGYNHQGDINIAKEIIVGCKRAGVDVVKLQKQDMGPDGRFTEAVLNRPYISKNSYGATYGEHRSTLELTEDEFVELQEFSKEQGITFTASGQDKPSFDFLHKIGVPFFKIGSGDIGNLNLIEYVAKLGRPIVLSTGMASLPMVQKSVECALKHNQDLTLLQCTSSYPLPDSDANLSVIQTYRRLFPNIKIGFSGHDQGLPLTLAAVAMGCEVVERHVTLDKTMKGSDHIASLDMEELSTLVSDIRRIDNAMGDGVKCVQPSEAACMNKLGKCLVYKESFKAGDEITLDSVVAKVHFKSDDQVPLDSSIFGTLVKDVIQYENVNHSDLQASARNLTEPEGKYLCFVTCTRADFSKMCPLIQKALETAYGIYIWISGMHLQKDYGSTHLEILKTFTGTRAKLCYAHNEASRMSQAFHVTCREFDEWLPDDVETVFVHGDRQESLACCSIAMLRNVNVCHIEGGELSGTVDESLRHAITKLSHLHLVSNERSKQRLIQMGENTKRIFVVGSPEINNLRSNNVRYKDIRTRYGIPFDQNYFVIAYHPITIHFNPSEIKHLVDTCIASNENFVVIKSNNDSNHEYIDKEYERFRDNPRFRLLPSMRFEMFVGLLKHSYGIIGNSSVGVRETPVLGIPSFNIGTRQKRRSAKSDSIINMEDYRVFNVHTLSQMKQMPRFETSMEFGNGNTSENFMNFLDFVKSNEIDKQKYFVDI